MDKHLGSGDYNRMTNHLIELENEKRDFLRQILAKNKNRNNDLKEKLERKKSRTSSQSDAIKVVTEELVPLKDRYLLNTQKIERIQSVINERHSSVQQLTKELDQNTNNQFVVREEIISQIDSLSLDFIHLSKDSNRSQNTERKHQIRESKEEIEILSNKCLKLKEELNQFKHQLGSTQGLDSNLDLLSIVSNEELSETGLDAKHDEWPIEDRMKALEIFSDENQLLTEDIELLKRFH